MAYIKNYPVHCTYAGGVSTTQQITLLVDDVLYQKCVDGFTYYISGQPGMTNFGQKIDNYLGVDISSKIVGYHGAVTGTSEAATVDEVIIPAMAAQGLNFKKVMLPADTAVDRNYPALTALTNNNQNINDVGLGGKLRLSNVLTSYYGSQFYDGFGCEVNYTFDGTSKYNAILNIYVVPSDFITSDGSFNKEKYPRGNSVFGQINCIASVNNSDNTFSEYQITGGAVASLGLYDKFPDNFKTTPYNSTDSDLDNPYGDDGTSTTGGGDGTLGGGGLDSVDPTEVPDLPTVSAAASGFITLYNPSSSVLRSLYSFLWSNTFDLDTFKKLYTDPMDCIISLGILPCIPESSGARNIIFGNVDSGVNCTTLSSQFCKIQCGSVNIEKYVGSFMDYSPYVKIHLFLPFIGFVNLGTDDLMGGSISITYHVDILSGDCIAFISHSIKGVLYTYNGNCRAEIPLTAQNNTGILRNYYESVAGIIPSTVNGAMSGGAAGAAIGAGAGALNAASNIVLNSKPTYQRSGSLAGSAGLMGVQKPFIVIERPNISAPNNVEHYAGQTSNITMFLGTCSGYTVCEYVHLEGIAATTEEVAEMETLLNQGVYL